MDDAAAKHDGEIVFDENVVETPPKEILTRSETETSEEPTDENGLTEEIGSQDDLDLEESDDQVFDEDYELGFPEEPLEKRKLSDSETPERSRVSELLQDAMESLCKNRWDFLEESSTFEYDRYGFTKVQSWEEEEDHHLRSRARKTLRKFREKESNMKEFETSVRVKWDNFLIGLGSQDLHPCPELKMLVRLGIPYQLRERIWKACVRFRIGNTKKQLGENYYKSLLEDRNRQKHFNPAAKQIELDLLRTLPNNKHFENLESPGIEKLRRVLVAYSYHNPLIGYCQGINRIAAVGLLFLNEEDAFWCLVTIIEYIMPADYYSRTLLAAQADQRVLKDVMQEKLPRLCQHLKKLDVDLSLFTFNWFLTVYVDNIPPETFLRIWDSFLYEGTKVLFRFAIAFFKFAESDIISLNDSMSLHKYLRYLGEMMLDYRSLCRIAFHDLNPFPMRFIRTRRLSSTQQVQSELEAMDAIREDFKSVQIPKERMRWWVQPLDE